jgi:hypothetical protein
MCGGRGVVRTAWAGGQVVLSGTAAEVVRDASRTSPWYCPELADTLTLGGVLRRRSRRRFKTVLSYPLPYYGRERE